MLLHEAIAAALAPGVALNSLIFYNNGLQQRFTSTTGRIRELNREARQLASADLPDAERLASIRTQVDLLLTRTQMIRRAMLTVYFGLFALVGAILSLLALALAPLSLLKIFAGGAFSVGLLSMASAAWFSWSEAFLSQRTVIEDIRTSHSRGE